MTKPSKETDEELFAKALANMGSDPEFKSKNQNESREIALKNSPSKAQSAGLVTIDLHGLTTGQAEDLLKQKIKVLISKERKLFSVRVITGKGIHSSEGPVLARSAHDFVRRQFAEWIQSIESSPAEGIISGSALRGHFDVILNPKSKKMR